MIYIPRPRDSGAFQMGVRMGTQMRIAAANREMQQKRLEYTQQVQMWERARSTGRNDIMAAIEKQWGLSGRQFSVEKGEFTKQQERRALGPAIAKPEEISPETREMAGRELPAETSRDYMPPWMEQKAIAQKDVEKYETQKAKATAYKRALEKIDVGELTGTAGEIAKQVQENTYEAIRLTKSPEKKRKFYRDMTLKMKRIDEYHNTNYSGTLDPRMFLGGMPSGRGARRKPAYYNITIDRKPRVFSTTSKHNIGTDAFIRDAIRENPRMDTESIWAYRKTIAPGKGKGQPDEWRDIRNMEARKWLGEKFQEEYNKATSRFMGDPTPKSKRILAKIRRNKFELVNGMVVDMKYSGGVYPAEEKNKPNKDIEDLFK